MSEPLKIALVSDWFAPRLGGIEIHLADLAGQLVAAGHEVTVFTSTPGPRRMGPVRVHRLITPRCPYHGFAVYPGIAGQMTSAFRQHGFDVVHSHISIISPAAWLGAWAAQKAGLPTMVTFHSYPGQYRPVFRWLDSLWWWTRWKAAFSAVGTSLAREMGSLLNGRPVAVLPNGVDADFWRTSPVPAWDKELRLVSVMRLDIRKRASEMIRIFARARSVLGGGPDLRLTIIGDGSRRGKVERTIRQLGVEDSVQLTGRLDRAAIRDIFARSDLFVLASRLESFGLAALEARGAGLPVIGRSICGLADFIADGRNGFLARTDSEMLDRIILLARYPDLLESIRKYNRGTVTPFDWPEVIPRHLEFYRRVMAG